MPDPIYDPAFAEPADRLAAYADFVAIVRQLRRDCPWDREQTHESVKHLLIEEAYETVEAIDEGDWPELKRELGDLLLHVVFHSVIAEQAGTFTLRDVIEAETEKLVRRHPHVFGDVAVDGVGEVLANWEQIKMQEGRKKPASGSTFPSAPAPGRRSRRKSASFSGSPRAMPRAMPRPRASKTSSAICSSRSSTTRGSPASTRRTPFAGPTRSSPAASGTSSSAWPSRTAR